MLKATPANPRDYISWTFKISPRDGICVFENMFKKALKIGKRPPMLQTSDLEKSDRNCHFKSDNYILILVMLILEN